MPTATTDTNLLHKNVYFVERVPGEKARCFPGCVDAPASAARLKEGPYADRARRDMLARSAREGHGVVAIYTSLAHVTTVPPGLSCPVCGREAPRAY